MRHGSNFIDAAHSFVHVAATLEAAIWRAKLSKSSAMPRLYMPEPAGPIENDLNLTNKHFPGNPTMSYRSRDRKRVLGEVTNWQGHVAAQRRQMREGLARVRRIGSGGNT